MRIDFAPDADEALYEQLKSLQGFAMNVEFIDSVTGQGPDRCGPWTLLRVDERHDYVVFEHHNGKNTVNLPIEAINEVEVL